MLCVAACDGNGVRARDAGAVGGGALGAGLGAIIGHATGHTGGGIAIGAGVGALAGALMGNDIDRANDQAKATDAELDAQQRQIEENERLLEELRALGTDVRNTDRGVVINLPDVLFRFDSAELTPEARHTAREIAEVLSKVPARKIAVEGHTDSIGSEQYNQRLSQNRARSVAGALVSNGVSRSALSVHGRGESDPIASNKTEAGRQRNRRVEVIVENQ